MEREGMGSLQRLARVAVILRLACLKIVVQVVTEFVLIPACRLTMFPRRPTQPMKQESDTKLARRKVLARVFTLLPAAFLASSCAGPATRSQTRQTARVQGRTEQRQANRRGW